jgi:hypothetical protein
MRGASLSFLAFLGAIITCGGEKTATTTPPGSDPASPCPSGYPYCPTLDACLLPGRTCPPVGDAGPGAPGSFGGGGAPSADAATVFSGADYLEAGPLPLASTPNQIRCGQATCSATNQYCCSGMGGSGNGSGFETCSDKFCPLRRECDETADCVGNEVCCYEVVAAPPPILAASCVPRSQCNFEGDLWVACATQADCAAVGAPPCVAQQCGTTTIQSCGPITRSKCR